MNPRPGPDLERLPPAVRRPGYDRSALTVGMAHLGVGAFHRCHQAEFTDELLETRFGPWGVVGVNIRAPELGPTLGRQDGLYTRLLREGDRAEARVIGCMLRVVDSQDNPASALAALADPEIAVVTMTVTEKGYCHRPATGDLDATHLDIVHDFAAPESPRSVPGLLVRALELRRAARGLPVTLMSCDNIPANGAILAGVVRALAERRGGGLAEWIAASVAFPSSMVDRIVPATSAADLAQVEETCGYRDAAVVVGEPFRQWVIEDRFAGARPNWDLAGAAFVADVTPFEHIKMRVLNAAQSTLSYLGVFAGDAHTYQAVADPLLEGFVRRMLVEETLSTLTAAPGMDPLPYVAQSLGRLHNTAIRHRCHQIATDGSQKIVQRLVNPAAERLAAGASAPRLTIAIASWMAYLIRASDRFGAEWTADDPLAPQIAAIADRIGRDPAALADAILGIDAVFAPTLAARSEFRAGITRALDGFLSEDPLAPVRHMEMQK